ncbi:MAG: amidase [Salinirussus sp.]
MHDLSEADVASLAAQYNIDVSEGDLADLAALANENLAGVGAVRDVATDQASTPGSDREWARPQPGEYNAIITECAVEPPNGAGDALAGRTVGLKDNIAVAGVPMTCGSPVLEGYVPTEDAMVVERLLDAGATITAKTNLDEFGNVGQGSNGYRGPVRNPYDTDHTAGGSSGGSAVAVLTDMVDVALGTDTGGSVRIPAAYCGLVGHKPTAGLVPAVGMFENTPLFDCIGPITETVTDAAAVLDAIAGPTDIEPLTVRTAVRGGFDNGDATSAATDPPPVETLTLGRLSHGFSGNTETTVAEEVDARLDDLADAGATIEDVTVADIEHATAVKSVMSLVSNAMYWGAGTHENRDERSRRPFAADFSARRAARGGQVNTQFKAKVIGGAALLERDHGTLYRTALSARERLQAAMADTLAGIDAIVTPTTPTVPTHLDNSPPPFDYGQNVRPASVTGSPATSIPAGIVDGLPVGLQLIGPLDEDAALLGMAAAVAAATE